MRSGEAQDAPGWRPVLAGPAVAAMTLVAAAVVTAIAGVPLRDPDGVASGRLAVCAGLVAVLIAIDVAVRAARRDGRRIPSWAAVAAVRRERWTRRRLLVVTLALGAFFVSYFAYRNLKSVVPLIRPGELFDRQLADLETGALGGNDPADLLHALLGTGAAAHALSAVYLFFFIFIPVSLALALVFSSDLRASLFYTTAFSANWMIGAGSYFILPSIGPFFETPVVFADLPTTPVTDLQNLLLDERAEFLRDPAVAGAAQSIGAFASLHVSVYLTAAIVAHLLGFGRTVKAVLWTLVALTVTATVYFGWHYMADDVGGAAIAVLALMLARALTGFDLSARRLRSVHAPRPEPA